jgi:hypothetical protein
LSCRNHIGGAARQVILNPLLLTCLVLCLFAVGFCWHGAASRGFEYDELWTLNNYVRKDSIGDIFRDLAKPNNHPLHTLLVRSTVGRSDRSELRTRLPSLLAGIGLLAVLLPFFRHCTGDREVALLAFAWSIESAPLLHFSQTARGYTLQTLLIVAFAFLVGVANRRANREALLLAAAVVAGIAAVLTLPTSVLYLVPLAACDLTSRMLQLRGGETGGRALLRRAGKPLLAYAILFALAASWLWYVSKQLAGARETFGISITSGRDWVSFCARIWNHLYGGPMVVLIACGILFSKRRGLTAWLVAVMSFPFVLAPLTRAGPERVYAPLVSFGFLAAAMGFCRLIDLLPTLIEGRIRKALMVVVALLPLVGLPSALAFWTPTDWRRVIPVLHRYLPENAFINYPSTAGYVIRHYFFPQVGQDVSQRVPMDREFTLVQLDNNAAISAVEPRTGASTEVPVGPGYSLGTETVAGVTVTYYRAQRVESLDAAPVGDHDDVYFAAIGPGTMAAVREASAEMCGSDERSRWGVLDALLSEAFVPTGISSPTVGVLLVSRDPQLTRDQMRQMSVRRNDRVRFYILKRAS